MCNCQLAPNNYPCSFCAFRCLFSNWRRMAVSPCPEQTRPFFVCVCFPLFFVSGCKLIHAAALFLAIFLPACICGAVRKWETAVEAEMTLCARTITSDTGPWSGGCGGTGRMEPCTLQQNCLSWRNIIGTKIGFWPCNRWIQFWGSMTKLLDPHRLWKKCGRDAQNAHCLSWPWGVQKRGFSFESFVTKDGSPSQMGSTQEDHKVVRCSGFLDSQTVYKRVSYRRNWIGNSRQ